MMQPDATHPSNSNPSRSRPNRALIPALVFAAALIFSACGSDAVSTETTEVEVGSGSDAELGDSGVATLETASDVDTDSGESDGTDEPNDSDASPSEEAAVEEYMTCMSDAGVDVTTLNESATQDEIESVISSPAYVEADRECSYILEDAFGSFELDPEMEALLAERSVVLAECAREVLGVEIPDDILLLEEDDPRILELDAIETTPEEEAELEACAEEALGDLLDDEGGLIVAEAGE